MLVPANKFSDDVYMVRITSPEGIGDLMDDEGTLMEQGRFSFDSTQEVPTCYPRSGLSIYVSTPEPINQALIPLSS